MDSSAIIKRAVSESESEALEKGMSEWLVSGHQIATSTVGFIETSRAVRLRREADDPRVVAGSISGALSGLAEYPIDDAVAALARRIGSRQLRSLDAIHLATALVLDAELFVGYDQRLLAAAEEMGLLTASPN